MKQLEFTCIKNGDKYMLNYALARKKNLTDEQMRDIVFLHTTRTVMFLTIEASQKTSAPLDVMEANHILQDLEFQLQQAWDWPLDAAKHSWWYEIPGCICPKDVNDPHMKQEGVATRTLAIDCRFHGYDRGGLISKFWNRNQKYYMWNVN